MASQRSSTVIHDINKPAIDKRLYRGLVLSNEIKVCLISEPEADKAAASMCVNVGSLSSPLHMQGVPHFLEHMLFMGTEKYPGENDYTEYLTNHGGSANAYTSGDDTVYMFDCAPDALKGALDIFSTFFICPTFSESATDREVKAVHSEFKSKYYLDGRRSLRLFQILSKPGHAAQIFSTGNEDSLVHEPLAAGINTRQTLMDFHKKYYSSNIMNLVVFGKESLDELQVYAEEMFSEIVNKHISAPRYDEPPYGPEQLKKCVRYVTVKDIRSMSIRWPVPYTNDVWEESPSRYAHHLLGHEGPGSLLSMLKERQLANSLTIYGMTRRAFSFSALTMELTEEGIDKTDEILRLVYSYINMMKKEGVQEWIFKERHSIDVMKFQYRNQTPAYQTVINVAEVLQYYPLEEMLSGPPLWKKYNPDLINGFMDCLSPDNMVVFVGSKKFEGQTDLCEPIYDIKYMVEDYSPAILQEFSESSGHPGLRLPKPNAFVAENLDLVERDPESAAAKGPRIIKETNISRCWFHQDSVFLVPKLSVAVKLTSPVCLWSPIYACLTTLFVDLLTDSLAEFSYDAEMAGLIYQCVVSGSGITITMEGFSHKMPSLLEFIMKEISSFVVKPDRFTILKEERKKKLENFTASSPYLRLSYHYTHVVKEKGWTVAEQLAVYDNLTESSMTQFISTFLSGGFVEVLVYGNATVATALDLMDRVECPLVEKANLCPLPAILTQSNSRVVKLLEGADFLYEVKDKIHDSSAVFVSYEMAVSTDYLYAYAFLLKQTMKERFFDVLRTKEQLGYIVYSITGRVGGVHQFQLGIQSEKSPSHVITRVDAFLESMKSQLADMTAEEFEAHRQASITQLEEKPKKLHAQFREHWNHIELNTYQFDRKVKVVDVLRKATKQELLEVSKYVIPSSEESEDKRKRLIVSIICSDHKSQQVTLEQAAQTKLSEMVMDRNRFKGAHSLHPLPVSYLEEHQRRTEAKL